MSVLGWHLSTHQPAAAAWLYFSRSARKPLPRVCLPPTQTPPSTSTATIRSGHAKSKRHLRVVWNLCSGVGSGRLRPRMSWEKVTHSLQIGKLLASPGAASSQCELRVMATLGIQNLPSIHHVRHKSVLSFGSPMVGRHGCPIKHATKRLP